MHGNRKWTTQKVSQLLKQQGYKLLSDYQGVHEKISTICPIGHEQSISWASFQRGHRCKRCSVEQRAHLRRESLETVRAYLIKQGYQLLSSHYKGPKEKIYAHCPNGHIYMFQWYKFKKGHRCGKCAPNAKKVFQDIRDYVNSEGYSVVSDTYGGAQSKVIIKCPNEHMYEVTWTNFQQGHRCPYCLHKSEHKLGQILEELFPNKIKKQGNLGFLGRQRVDYYIEEEKIAIEYDGQQHYRPVIGAFGAKTGEEAQINLKEIQERDQRKEQLCKENGWRLIRIRYDEPLTMENIRSKIGE